MSLDTILVCLIYHFKIDFSTSIIELLTVVYEHIYHIIRIAKVVEFFQSALNVFGCKHFLPYLSIDFSLFFCHCSKS